jgi:uncharacterized protein
MKNRKIQRTFIQKSIEFAKSKMSREKASHSWEHAWRVTRMASHLAKAEKAEPFIVMVSAILHDIAREDEHKSKGKICHAEKGSYMAREFLLAQGLDSMLAERIAQCIREHRFRGNHKPSTLESRILYDADKLDSLGAVGIGRAFLFSGEVGARLHVNVPKFEATLAYSENDTAYREYRVKLKFLKNKMLTREGKKIARERHQFMKKFFDRFHRELRGIL